jgi:hypothetical protein
MRRSRLSNPAWAVGAGILASAAYFIARIVVATFRHMDFLRERMARYSNTSWKPTYPTASVVKYSVLILTEAFILWLALTQGRTTLWRRALACAAVALIASFIAIVTTHMHSPPAEDYHCAWLLWITTAMFVTTVGAGVARFVQRRRSVRSPARAD